MAKFKLNKDPLPKAESLKDLTILIYGMEKIGKTTLARQFPDAYFLFTEPGHGSLPEPTYGTLIDSWMEFKAAVRELGRLKSYSTIVVDTIDLAYRMCFDYVCKKRGLEHPSEDDWGQGWESIRSEFQETLMRLMRQPRGVIFLSHAKTKQIHTAAGGKRDQIVPTLPDSARRVVEPAADIFACYLYTPSGERLLQLEGSLDVAGGSRTSKDHFKHVRKIPMGGSEEEAFQNFMKAWNNEPIETFKVRKKKVRKKRKRRDRVA